MKVTTLYILPILLLSFACAYVKPPSEILNSFLSNFPEAKNSNWNQDGDYWNVNYKVRGLSYTTYMDTSGAVNRTECLTNYGALPIIVRESFEARFNVEEITSIIKVETQEEIYFELFMLTGNKKYKLTCGLNGDLIGEPSL